MREASFLFYEDTDNRGEPQYQQFFVTYTRTYNVPWSSYDIIPMLGDAEPELDEMIFDNEGVQTPRVMACQWERTPKGRVISVTVTWYQVRLYAEDTSTTSPAELNGSRTTREEQEWQNAIRYFVSLDGHSGISLGDSFPGDGDVATDRRVCVEEDNMDTVTLPGMVLTTVPYKGVRLTGVSIGNIDEIVKHPIYEQYPNRKEIMIFGVANTTGEEPARGSDYYADATKDLAARVHVRHEEDPYYLPGIYLYKLIYQGAIPYSADSATFMEIKGSRSYDTIEETTTWTTEALFYDEDKAYEKDDTYPQDTDYRCIRTQVQNEWLPGMNYQKATFAKYNVV